VRWRRVRRVLVRCEVDWCAGAVDDLPLSIRESLEELTALAATDAWRRTVVEYGRMYSVKTERDYEEF
jgi:hypothetical protein